MDTPEAMQTTFTGDGPTTHVSIPRAMAEADLGIADLDTDGFVAWIDANNDRIYESARRKRITPEGYEDVALEMGDLLTVMPLPAADEEDIDWNEKADVVQIGAIIGVDQTDYSGTLRQAVHYVEEIDLSVRGEFCIRTLSRIYDKTMIERLASELATH